MKSFAPSLPGGYRFLPLLAVAGFGFPAPLSAEPVPPVSIEPAVEVVPANHLKFYLQFPEPMERGDVFRHLRLVEIDDRGRQIAEVPEPFREVELWDETFTRMTLWFHPGRQKPGVNLNLEIGPVLEEGKRYRLEIAGDWRTESGAALGSAIGHEFTAGPVDDDQPNPGAWTLTSSLFTDEVLDPVSVRNRVEIFAAGKEIAFEVKGRRLVFADPLPHREPLRVLVDPRLEDLAGNSVARPFNLDLESESDFQEETRPIELLLTPNRNTP